MEKVEVLRDPRKLFLDRLTVAYELYTDATVVFPARQPFLLDWLLENLYRLLKSGSPKILEVIRSELFWSLLCLLLTDVDDGSLGGRKRKRREINLNKPFIPILTAFFEASVVETPTEKTIKLVERCIEWSVERAHVLNSPPKYMTELLMAATKMAHSSNLISSVGSVLCIWMDRQGNKRKVYGDLQDKIIHLTLLIPDHDTRRKVIESVFLCSEVFKDLVRNYKEMMKPIIASSMPLCEFMSVFVKVSRERLSVSEYRQAIMSMFTLIENSNKTPLHLLIDELAKSQISASQSDASWEICQQSLEQILVKSKDPLVFNSILRVDLGLISPHVDYIFSCYEDTPEWKGLFIELATAMSTARQLDKFISAAVKDAISIIPLELALSLRPLLVNLHSRVSSEIISSLVEWAKSHRPGAFNILNVFCTISLKLILSHLDELLKMEPSLPLCGLLQTLVERYEELPTSTLETISLMSQGHAGLSTILAIRGIGKFPQNLDNNIAIMYRHLPELLPRGCSVVLKGLPEWILQSALFWESLPSVDQLLLSNVNNLEDLIKVIRHIPDGILPTKETCEICLDVLSEAEFIREDCIIRLFSLETYALSAELCWKVFQSASPLVQSRIFELDLISDRQIVEYCASLERMLQLVDLFGKHLDKISKESRKILQSLFIAFNTVSDDPNFYRLIAFLAKVDPTQFLQQVILPDENHQWRLRASLYEYDLVEHADVNLIAAIDVYLSSENTLTGRDLGRFIKGSSLDLISTALGSLVDLPFTDRIIGLLDAFLVQCLDIQLLVCPLVDQFIIKHCNCQSTSWAKLVLHRAACGGTNIGTFQDEELFDSILIIITSLVSSDPMSALPILSLMVSIHWNVLMKRRPVLISMLVKLLPHPKAARLLLDFSSHRQANQQFYIIPLLLHYTLIPDAEQRRVLQPAMCMLLRHLEMAAAGEGDDEGGERVKFFSANPLERLMRLTTTDDSKVILKNLITLYRDEYKYTGKA